MICIYLYRKMVKESSWLGLRLPYGQIQLLSVSISRFYFLYFMWIFSEKQKNLLRFFLSFSLCVYWNISHCPFDPMKTVASKCDQAWSHTGVSHWFWFVRFVCGSFSDGERCRQLKPQIWVTELINHKSISFISSNLNKKQKKLQNLCCIRSRKHCQFIVIQKNTT